MLARRHESDSLSDGVGSAGQSLESQGDINASQTSLGEEAGKAMTAMGGLGLGDKDAGIKDDELAVVSVPRRSPRTSGALVMHGAPSLVIEGIVGMDSLGVAYSPQKALFTYSSANSTHAKLVDKAIAKLLSDFNKVPDCHATRFKTVVHDYAGIVPTAVGGLSAKYKNKSIPVTTTEEDSPRSSKRKRK